MRYFGVASVDSLMIYFGQEIGDSVAKKVREAFYTLKNTKLKHVIEIVPSYTSIMVSYDFSKISYLEMRKMINEILDHAEEFSHDIKTRSVSVPVYYGSEVGLDLENLAKMKNLTVEEIISLHVNKEYSVYAIGFSPGFPYMGEVDEVLATPRLANPRAKVPKGSVGIADKQTAIYPQLSPGGWQILGRTPIDMFDTSYDGFSYLKVGDKVKFRRINKEEFLVLGGEL